MFCFTDGNAKCEYDNGSFEYAPGPGGGLSAAARFLPFLSAGLDFGYYTFNPKAEGDWADYLHEYRIRLMTIMLQVSGHLPFPVADPYIKLAIGYSSLRESEQGDDWEYFSRLYTFFEVKVGMGITFYFVESESLGQIGAGLDFDFIPTNPEKWKACESYNGDEECDDDDLEDEYELVDVFQLSVHFTWMPP